MLGGFARTPTYCAPEHPCSTWVMPTRTRGCTHLDGSQGCHYCGRPEAVGDEREVCEVTLDGGIEDLLWAGVAKWGAVLVQQVHQLLGNDPVKLECEREN